tara:strand:+ start:674 stop:1510 length:837 start_codon:yes stop_codon:yes gene_type:complete
MTKSNNLGFMQGRLSPTKANKIQFFPEKYWKKEFSLANKLGLKNMEWTLDHKNLYKNPIFTEKGIREIRYLSKKYKVKIKTLTGDCFMQKPFWRFSNSKKYIEDLKKVINACGNLKIKYIIFPLVDNSSIKNKKEENKIISEFKKLNYILSLNKVKILFESNYPPKNLKKFIKKFDLKNFGINYDSGNSASLNYDSDTEFSYYGSYIKNIHVKDRILKGKTIRLGEGNANFKKVFKNIKKINYNKLLILQTARSLIKNKDFEELKINMDYIKTYLNEK